MRTTGRPSPHRMRSVAIRKSALSGSVSSRQGRRYIGCTSASRQGMQITRLGGLSENGLGTSRSSRSSSRRRGYSGSERPVIHVEPAIGALHAARGGIECDVLQGMQGCEHIELVTDECPEASGREDWLPEQEWKKADKSVACDDRKQRDDKEDMANAVVTCRALEHDEANGQQGCSPDDQRLPRLRQEQRQCFQVAGGFSTGLGKSKRVANPNQQSRREQYQENFGQPRSELRWNVGPGQPLGGEELAPMRKCERGGVAGKVGECENELRKRIADLQPRPQRKSRDPCQQQGRGCAYTDLHEGATGRSLLVEDGLEGAQGHGANQISLRDDAGRTGGDRQSGQQTGRDGRLPRGYPPLRHDDDRQGGGRHRKQKRDIDWRAEQVSIEVTRGETQDDCGEARPGPGHTSRQLH